MLGLQKSNAVQRKQQLEQDFLNALGSDAAKKEKYSALLNEFKKSSKCISE